MYFLANEIWVIQPDKVVCKAEEIGPYTQKHKEKHLAFIMLSLREMHNPVYFTNQFSVLDKNGGSRGIDKILHRFCGGVYGEGHL